MNLQYQGFTLLWSGTWQRERDGLPVWEQVWDNVAIIYEHCILIPESLRQTIHFMTTIGSQSGVSPRPRLRNDYHRRR